MSKTIYGSDGRFYDVSPEGAQKKSVESSVRKAGVVAIEQKNYDVDDVAASALRVKR